MYIHLTIASGKDILGPEGPYISFPHNFTKKYFFSKVRLVSDSARQDISKESIKIGVYKCLRFNYVNNGNISRVYPLIRGGHYSDLNSLP